MELEIPPISVKCRRMILQIKQSPPVPLPPPPLFHLSSASPTSNTNPFISPSSPTYMNSNLYRYFSLFRQNYSPNSPSDSSSFDGGDIAATEQSLHENSRILEYQQLYNRHTVCLARLHEFINEIDSLRCENNSLRLSNADLTRRLTLLANQNCLSDFNRLNIVPSSTVSVPPYSSQIISSQPLKEENRLHCTPERVTIQKSISVRSSGYLKTRLNHDVTRQQVGGQLGPQSQQRVYVPGSKREEEALEFDVYNQGMQKTELCNKLQETGTCPYGDNCQFAHGIKELRPVIRHPRYKTEVCRIDLAGDICPYGLWLWPPLSLSPCTHRAGATHGYVTISSTTLVGLIQ